MALYGDLMTALIYTLFFPLYVNSYLSDPDPKATLPIFFEVSACLLHWIAWAKNHHRLSVLAFVAQVGCIATNVIFQWPFGTDPTLLPQFLWVIVHASCNMTLSAPTKVFMIAYGCAWAIVATLVTESLETLPTVAVCAGATTLACAAHLYHKDLRDELFGARMAVLVLCGVSVHHMMTEIHSMMLIPGYAPTGAYNIMKMGIVASMGVVATGAFRDQVSIKQSLQSLVRTRGREMARQAEIMEMISMALEASETGIAITDEKHVIIWSNNALKCLLDVKAVKAGQTSLVDTLNLTQESAETFCACFSTSQKAMEVHRNEKDIRLVVSPFVAAKANSKGVDDGRVRFLVALSDVSQLRGRERAEKAAEQAARTAMQESMETLTHELRTPLQGNIGMTSLVLDSNEQTPPEEMYQCMNTVMASSRLLLTLINNLLDSHKMDANMMDAFQLDSVPLADAMRDSVNFCRPIAALSNTDPQLCIDFDENESVFVRSNPVRFQQVLVNLVSNAIKYAGNGSITLRAEVVSSHEANDRFRRSLATGNDGPAESILTKTPRVAIISVEDSGEGIPADMVDRVFQKFSQYSNPSKSFTRSGCFSAYSSGTGIGLNLCRKFVDRMDGNIWVTNKPTGGACFSFCIPIVESPDNGDTPPDKMLGQSIEVEESKSQAEIPVPTMPDQVLKVLVVDDTLINLKVLERMIQRISSSYNVTATDSGLKALKELSRCQYDLVITDIQMPQMDGIELCQAIRDANSLNPKPVVVALTAETSESLHRRCAAVGISHILNKPISSHQFKSFFESTLRTLTPCSH